MIHLRTLGTFRLLRPEEDGGGPRPASGGPDAGGERLEASKRAALLAYLSVARPRGMQRRDSLLALFWPELPERRARHALSQALYVLRRQLGKDALVGTAQTAGLDRERVRCDATAFEEALESGRREAALDLYRGHLLEGFALSECPAFGRWLEGERSRLRGRAVAAARSLAADRQSEGSLVAAVRWRRRAADLAPLNEAVHRELLRTLAAAGDRRGALGAHRGFAGRLGDTRGIEPSSETRALVADIRDDAREGRGTTEAGGPNAARAEEAGADGSRAPFAGAARPAAPAGWRAWPGAAVVAAAAVAAVAAFGLLGPTSGSGGAAAPAAAPGSARAGIAPGDPSGITRLVVLPFVVRGAGEHDYLGPGMSELLSAKLDGAGTLRAVDARSVLGFVERLSTGPGSSGAGATGATIAPAVGRAVARNFGASLFVLGTVVDAGGRLRLQATLYDADGARVGEATAGDGTEADLFALVDELARGIVAAGLGTSAGRLPRLAAATSASVDALQAYLEGQRALREGRFGRARGAFGRAVARDSTFALAWYGLAVASDWTVHPGRSEEAARQAVRYAARLPAHEREVLFAWRAYTRGDALEAERLYRSVVDTYPEDLDAWFQLGEVLYHFGWRRGYPVDEARRAFERTLALDPAHEGALLHLARIAGREGRREDLDTVTARLLEVAPGGSPVSVEARALRAFALAGGAAGMRARALLDIRARDPRKVFPALWTVFYVRDEPAADTLAGLLTEPNRPQAVRAAGHLLRAVLERSRGRRRAADAQLTAAARLDPAWALAFRSLFAAFPYRARPGAEPARLRAELRRWDPLRSADSLGADDFLPAHIGAHGPLRIYLSGLLAARAGEAEAAVSAAEALEVAGRADATGLTRRLASGLQAEVLRRAGRREAALEALAELRPRVTYERPSTSPFFALSRERFLRAELLAELGRHREALRAYDSFDDGFVYDFPYRAPAHLRRAEIHQRLGNRERAVEHYRRFVRAWEEADPTLLPEVEEARRRIEELRGAEAP